MITKEPLKDKLIKQIINRLKKFGFVHVNENNIGTDEVYRLYFFKILKEKLGEDQELDLIINQLLSTLNFKNENNSLK